MNSTEVLSAPLVLQFDYTRSTGPVVGAFLTGLRNRRILGATDSAGQVVVPPMEYDAVTAAAVSADELVAVADTGVVVSWSWNPTPRPGQPFDRPFAWALVRLDGADTAMLHALDAPREAIMTGLLVRVRWAEQTSGAIGDILCFEPTDGAAPVDPAPELTTDAAPVIGVVTPIRLDYRYTPGQSSSDFLRSIREGKVNGRRCPTCRKVYFPPRGGCPMCGIEFTETVTLADTGTLVTFAIVNVNFANRAIELPYVSGEVLFDGADTTTMVLVRGIATEQVRMGMRVRAQWKPEAEWDYTLANIDHVQPLDEPDRDYDSFKDYV